MAADICSELDRLANVKRGLPHWCCALFRIHIRENGCGSCGRKSEINSYFACLCRPVQHYKAYKEELKNLSIYVISCSLLQFQRLASGDQRKSQPALQEDSLQQNKRSYTMNTDFKSVYEPWLKHNMSQNNGRRSQPSCSGGTYSFSRNVPHPRMVYHMQGKGG